MRKFIVLQSVRVYIIKIEWMFRNVLEEWQFKITNQSQNDVLKQFLSGRALIYRNTEVYSSFPEMNNLMIQDSFTC